MSTSLKRFLNEVALGAVTCVCQCVPCNIDYTMPLGASNKSRIAQKFAQFLTRIMRGNRQLVQTAWKSHQVSWLWIRQGSKIRGDLHDRINWMKRLFGTTIHPVEWKVLQIVSGPGKWLKAVEKIFKNHKTRVWVGYRNVTSHVQVKLNG